MEKLTNKIDQTIYGYDPKEFMPIFQDGQLANRSAFMAYKVRRAGQRAGRAIGRTIEVTSNVVEHLQQTA